MIDGLLTMKELSEQYGLPRHAVLVIARRLKLKKSGEHHTPNGIRMALWSVENAKRMQSVYPLIRRNGRGGEAATKK